MNNERIRKHLGYWLGDTCNRYLSKLIDLGVVNEKTLAERKDDILNAKGDLLEEWTPQYWKFLKKMIEENN